MFFCVKEAKCCWQAQYRVLFRSEGNVTVTVCHKVFGVLDWSQIYFFSKNEEVQK